jgi:hypothetical protein
MVDDGGKLLRALSMGRSQREQERQKYERPAALLAFAATDFP